MPLSDDDIREILRLIDESDLDELRVETDTFSLYVRCGDTGASPAAAEPIPEAAEASPESPHEAAAGSPYTISAPMLGTFYRAHAPGAPPFVDEGKRVEPDTIVCLIEVMKMMNPVPAGVAGTIVEVCAENAQLVESGVALFNVEVDR